MKTMILLLSLSFGLFAQATKNIFTCTFTEPSMVVSVVQTTTYDMFGNPRLNHMIQFDGMSIQAEEVATVSSNSRNTATVIRYQFNGASQALVIPYQTGEYYDGMSNTVYPLKGRIFQNAQVILEGGCESQRHRAFHM